MITSTPKWNEIMIFYGINIDSNQYYIIHDHRQCMTPPEFEVLLLELIYTWEVTYVTYVLGLAYILITINNYH